MHDSTLSTLREYYAGVFGIKHSEVWQAVTVRTHVGRLEGYEGSYVAWRGSGVHVSTPPDLDAEAEHVLRTEAAATLQDRDFWDRFAKARDLSVVGPSMHAYLDRDPGPVERVVPVTEADLESLRASATAADWTESGWDDRPPHMFGIHHDGRLVAAANLNPFHGEPRDVGVLVAPDMRGHGLSVEVAQHAASFAIRTHGFARWGARDNNAASVAGARRLGFDKWCSQLAVR